MNFKKIGSASGIIAVVILVNYLVGNNLIGIIQADKAEDFTRQEITAPKAAGDPNDFHSKEEQNSLTSETTVTTISSPPKKTDAPTEATKPSLTAAEEREITAMLWDLENDPPSPDDANYDALYGGPFDDEVRLVNMDDDCVENCAEVLTELMPAEGKYADQVNPDALMTRAQAEGILDNSDVIPLVDPDPSSGPPVD